MIGNDLYLKVLSKSFLPFNKFVKWSPVSEAGLSNLDILHQTEISNLRSEVFERNTQQIAHLMEDPVGFPVPRSLGLVRFDGPAVQTVTVYLLEGVELGKVLEKMKMKFNKYGELGI